MYVAFFTRFGRMMLRPIVDDYTRGVLLLTEVRNPQSRLVRDLIENHERIRGRKLRPLPYKVAFVVS